MQNIAPKHSKDTWRSDIGDIIAITLILITTLTTIVLGA